MIQLAQTNTLRFVSHELPVYIHFQEPMDFFDVLIRSTVFYQRFHVKIEYTNYIHTLTASDEHALCDGYIAHIPQRTLTCVYSDLTDREVPECEGESTTSAVERLVQVVRRV